MDTFGHMNNNLTSKLLKIFPLYFPYLLNTSTDGHTDLTVRSFMRYNSFSALVSFLSQVKILSPFLFSNFDELDHQSLRQMGEGHVYICSEVTQQGSFSHQRLTSTSSSGHVQRQSFLSFLIFVLAASRCQHGSVKWLFEKITQIIILNRQSKKSVILVFCFQK